jgi:all-trans-retinol 13,14-reductase
MERRRDWDAIVIGSGLGGLTCAAYLAASGRRTLVVEQYDTAGGSSHVFRRRGGYEFDVGLHYLGDCRSDGVIPRVLRGLALEDRVAFRPMDPDGFDTLVFPDLEFRVPAGWERYRERLIATFPSEERGLRRCVGVLERIGHEVDRGARGRPRLGTVGMALHSRALVRWGLRPLDELFDACGLSPAARAVLCGESGDYGAPPSRAAVAVHGGLMHHYLKDGAFYPQGGGQVLAANLVDVIRTHGGAVRTRALVERILVEGGSVAGVALPGGEELRAPVVVSNADITRTFLELLPPDACDPRMRERLARARMALPLFCLYLGVDVDLRERMPNTNIWAHTALDPNAMYRDADAGRLPDPSGTSVYVTSATLKDPSNPHLAPPGHSSLEVMTIVTGEHAPWRVGKGPVAGERYSRDPDYRAAKAAVMETLLARTEELLPGIRAHVTWCEGATPITQERYTRSTLGASYGLDHTPRQIGPRRPGPRTSVPGLFLTGASTRMGHGIAGVMLGGVATAGAVVGRDLLGVISSGAVLADRTRLRDPSAPWDPLLASKRLSWKTGRARERPAQAPEITRA